MMSGQDYRFYGCVLMFVCLCLLPARVMIEVRYCYNVHSIAGNFDETCFGNNNKIDTVISVEKP